MKFWRCNGLNGRGWKQSATLLRGLLLAGLAIGLGACSTVKEELKPAQLEPLSTYYLWQQEWRRIAGAGEKSLYARLQPALVDDRLYTVDVKGSLNAWDVSTGKRLWRQRLRTAIGSGVGAADGLGFVGTLDGHVIAFDLQNGAEKWRARVSSEVLAIPQSNGEVVITHAIDGRVFAFDAETGRQLWNYDHPVPVLTLRSNAAPYIKQNTALIGFDNGQLLNFASDTGRLRWIARVGQPQGKTELERLIDVDSQPLEFGPYIYTAGYNSRLVALSVGTGRIVWAQDVSTIHNLAAADNKIFVSDANSHIKAFDALTGTLVWQNDRLHRRGTGAPAVFGDLVVVVDAEGYLHGLDMRTGDIKTRTRIRDGAVYATPLVQQDTLYLLGRRGVLSAYTAQFSEIPLSIWDLPTGRAQGPIPTKPNRIQ